MSLLRIRLVNVTVVIISNDCHVLVVKEMLKDGSNYISESRKRFRWKKIEILSS